MEPSSAEIARRLDEVSTNLRDGFDRMNLRLDRYVLAEVHNIYVRQAERRMDDLEERMERAEDHRGVNIRYVITTAIAVVALLASAALGIIAAT